ncbi:UNVERIFIED_CONTAM: hypothetical protein GTU68_061885 [Idotea baltica]|nr:hypothetical protein [Idotea baltica]
MGTTWSVKTTVAPSTSLPDESQFTERLIAVNKAMSTWDSTSEISRFNASESTEWFSVSARFAAVVAESLRIASLTKGAFDPTVAPLIDLWNFGSTAADFKVPTDEQIQAVRPFVGFDKLHVRLDPPAVRKSHPMLTINLSAIAKGYGVDAVADVIRTTKAGPASFLAEIGGEIVAQGTAKTGEPWKIGIEKPVAGERAVMQTGGRKIIVPLDNLAMATSGDYRNFFEVDGMRYSHSINPNTGRPVTHDLVSVTVLHNSCMTADAMATALLVMGPEDGYNLARSQQLPVLMLIRRDGTFIEKHTRWFPELATKPAALQSPRATNMKTFIIAAVVFLLAVTGMAIGVIVSNRRLKGSCGGLSSMKNGETKPMCDLCSIPPEQCDTFRDAIKSQTQK